MIFGLNFLFFYILQVSQIKELERHHATKNMKKLKASAILVLTFICAIHAPVAKGKTVQTKTPLDLAIENAQKWSKKKNQDSARYYASMAMDLATDEGNKAKLAVAALIKAQNSNSIEKREAIMSYFVARKFAIEAKESAVQFRADLTIGSIYGHETKFDSAKFYYNEALKIAENMVLANRSVDNLRRLGMVNNNYGILYMNVDQLSKAAYYLTETERIGREIKDTVMMFRAAVNVGAIYNELGSPENKVSSGFTQKLYLKKAVQFFNKALQLLTPADEEYLPSVLNNLGISYLSMGLYDSSAMYLEKALALHQKFGANADRICNCHLNLGSAYYKLNKFDASNTEFDKAISIGETNDLKTCLISVLSNKGQLFTHWNRLDEAESVLKRAMELKNSIKGSHDNYLLYEKFYLLYEKKKDFKKAFEYYKMFVGERDSVADVEHLNVLDDIEIRYGTEIKDEQIETLGFEKQLLIEKDRTKEAQLRLREFWIIGLVIFLLMAGMIVWFWIQQSRLRHQRAAIDLEHRLLRARMNPHFLFNGLNTIQKHYASGNQREADAFMADFSKFLRMILNKTGETSHSLENELEFTALYVSLEQRKFPNRIEYAVELAPGLDASSWTVPSLLFQPIVENAIWHGILPTAKDGMVRIHIFENDNHSLVCEFIDSGIGYDQSMKAKNDAHKSKAFELIQKRLGKNGSLTVETLTSQTKETAGTKVTIIMKGE